MLDFEKNEFKRGESIELILVREIEVVDYYGETYYSQTLKDIKGRYHKLKVLSLYKDDSQKIGDSVTLSVVGIYPDYSPKISSHSLPEAHFIELSSFSKSVRSSFNEIASYSSENLEFNLQIQYENRNGNWIWTFLKHLKELQEDSLNNYDFDGFRKLQSTQLEVAETIIKGKFLLEFKEEKRKQSKIRLNKVIDRSNSILDLLDFIIDSEEEEKEKEILKIAERWASPKDSTQRLESNFKLLFIFTKIDKYISNTIIEKALLKVLEFDGEYNHLKIQLNEWVGIRKKRVRSEIFHEDVYNPKISNTFYLQDNPELEHLIALTQFDHKVYCLREDDNYLSIIIESTLLRFKGYLFNDVKYVEESIKLLYENIGKDTLIDDKYYRTQWRFSFNFELSMSYRFLGKNSSLLDETIKFYKTAFLYSQKTRSKNQIVDEGFIKYFEMAQVIENGASLAEIKDLSRKNLIFYGELMEKPSNKEEIKNNLFLSQLIDIFKILKLIKFNNDIRINWGARENMHKLFDYAMEKYSPIDDKREDIDRLYTSEIAALVLASNLIGDGRHELLQSQLAKVFSKGVVEVQKFSTNEIDVDSDEYKEIQLMNLISKGESQTLEFKGSWNLAIDLFILPKDKRKEHENKWWTQSAEVSRAVASMLNANRGGKLYIGVLENKKKYRSKGYKDALKERMNCEELKGGGNLLVGVESEIKARGWDSDTLIQNINNQLKEDIHDSAIKHCIIKSRLVKNKEIIEINISENSFIRSGWWINDAELPVRENNQINTLRGGTANRWLEEQAKGFL